MQLSDLAKIIYTPDSADINVTVVVTNAAHSICNELWKGESKDLHKFCECRSGYGWIVDEIRDEETNSLNRGTPYYARNKIISVI